MNKTKKKQTHRHKLVIIISHKQEIMPGTATWMDLEVMILSNVSQKEKNKYHMILLIRGL